MIEKIIKVEDADIKMLFADYELLLKKGNNSGNKFKYFKQFVTFDIETTNLADIEQAFMYVWQMQIGNYTVIGRYWSDFLTFLFKVKFFLQKKVKAKYFDSARLIVFVHNLSFEFQFLKGVYRFKNDDIFAISTRKIAKCVIYDFFEFRCSYLHSNMALDRYCKKMGVKDSKLSGEAFNYSKIRTPRTELTDFELQYCINDVRGLREAILIDMEKGGDDVYTFPLTSTGYVRRDVKKELKKLKKGTIENLMPDRELYGDLRNAFRGGDTHASRFYSNRILKNVKSFDRSSSYPDVIVNYKYPIRKFRKEKDLSKERESFLLNKGKALLLTVVLCDIKVKKYEAFPYIPVSKVLKFQRKDNKIFNDNGRLLSASKLVITLTDIDFKIIKEQYEIKDYQILKMWSSSYGELPYVYKNLVINYYIDKTNLKGVDDYFYAKSKEKLNSLYGLMAQDPARNNIEFRNNVLIEKIVTTPSEKALLPYQWGVWTTAWARYALREGVKCVENPIYCDTDSIKFTGEHDFTKLNKKYQKMSNQNNAYAVDSDGVKHYMGVFEEDGSYDAFKTLGAKKYACVENEKLKITIAGVPKIKGANQLQKLENFEEGFIFTDGCTLVKHNDNVNVNVNVMGESIHITDNIYIGQGSYQLGLTVDYAKLLTEIQKGCVLNENL